MTASCASRVFASASSCVRSWIFASSSRFISSSAWFFADSDAISCWFSCLSRYWRRRFSTPSSSAVSSHGFADVLVQVRAVDRVDHRVEAGLAGQQDLRRRGQPAIDDLEQLDALHAGHDLIGDHERDRLALARELVEQRDRFVARARGQDLALVAEPRAELRAQHAQHALFVVDADDDLFLAHAVTPPAAGPRTRCGRAPTRSASRRRASRRSGARCRGRGPVPSPFGLVVKNGSKIRGSTSAGHARTVVDHAHDRPADPRRSVSIAIVPLPASACCAFEIRFVHTWLSSSTNTGTRGKHAVTPLDDDITQRVVQQRERRLEALVQIGLGARRLLIEVRVALECTDDALDLADRVAHRRRGAVQVDVIGERGDDAWRERACPRRAPRRTAARRRRSRRDRRARRERRAVVGRPAASSERRELARRLARGRARSRAGARRAAGATASRYAVIDG